MTHVAIILAGGLGKRLRSVVNDRPKPMALIQNKPFLAYQMDYWISQGVSRFVLSVGYKYDMIVDYFGYEYNGAAIDYAIETQPLGTGGGLMLALDMLGSEEKFLLLNGDTYFTVELQQLINFANEHDADFTFSLFRTHDKDRYMGVELDESYRVRNLKSSLQIDGYHLASGGVYWVRNIDMFTKFRNLKNTVISFEDQILPSIHSAGKNIFGMQFVTNFIDIGVPADYLRAGLVLTEQDTVHDESELEKEEG